MLLAWGEPSETEAELGEESKSSLAVLANMTAFASSNLPAGIVTLEQLALWTLGALYQLHKKTEYQESDASPLVPIITAQDGLAANDTERVIFRVSLPLSDTWRESATKFWQEGQEISSVAIPPQFLS